MRPFHDETKLNETPSLSLHNLAMADHPQPSEAEAMQHHADLLADLAEKSKIIDKLEEEIDTLRTALDEAKTMRGIDCSAGTKKSVNSLLEDLSLRENQIFEKEEEVVQLQDQIIDISEENDKLKCQLSQLLNNNFSPDEAGHDGSEDEERATVEEETLDSAAKQIDRLTNELKAKTEIITQQNKQIDLLQKVTYVSSVHDMFLWCMICFYCKIHVSNQTSWEKMVLDSL